LIKLLIDIIEIATLAGKETLNIYAQKKIKVTQKENHTPVTEADIIAHHIIYNRIKVLTPNTPIVSEESSTSNIQNYRSNIYWLIDPIDGTEGFIKKNKQFTINIALIENKTPILGVVYAPALDELYYAYKNTGAYKVSNSITKKITAYDKGKPKLWHIICSHRKLNTKVSLAFKSLGDFKLETMSSSLKICRVAEGYCHIYPRFHPTSEWDTAAAQCIATEANANIIRLDTLITLKYNISNDILNPPFIVIPNSLKRRVFEWIRHSKNLKIDSF
jgi:3'(2'), 5'-bisphosphate nucleotidase